MDTHLPSSFGLLVRSCRIAAGLSQEELAERAGLSRRSIGDIERGVSEVPRKETVVLLAQALSLSEQASATFQWMARRRAPTPLPTPAELLQSVPLVGRQAEQALLERHLAGSGPPILLLAGEPGIGKTRLLKLAAALGRDRGLSVLEGSCGRRSAQAPFDPILAVLAKHLRAQPPAQQRAAIRECGWLGLVLPELVELDTPPRPALAPAQERRLVYEAVLRYLGNAAGPGSQGGARGTLLVLDNLQWAGTETLDLLLALATAAAANHGEVPVLVVGAYRDTELQPQDPLTGVLADLAHAGLASSTLLAPLSPPEAARLLAGLLEEEPPAAVRAYILHHSGGIPFFLVAWARLLREQLSAGTPSSALLAGDLVPWEAAQAVRARIAALPAATHELLYLAAVAEEVVSCALLAAVTEQAPWQVAADLLPACQARVLAAEGPEHFRFTHALLREVVAADRGSVVRAQVQRRLAVGRWQQEKGATGKAADALDDETVELRAREPQHPAPC
jgi:transcriptional regulator with XRE-family HTH domain